MEPPAKTTPISDQKQSAPQDRPPAVTVDICDVCGSDRVHWRLCKLICDNCRAIVKSCADL